ncbi:PH domain-containing protein [Xylanimonas allomyrinae]|uniref:PH domain-containing protein n=1 Tax=Xylanimonas allomyrinae TaxID=2509459 RepID=UPI001FEAC8E8|nr:PH domain-containing protein [Xylanimonas allomyrinae]
MSACPGLDDVAWKPVSPRLVRGRVLATLAWCAVPAAAGVALAVVVSPWWWFLAGPFLAVLGSAAASPAQVAAIGWAERDSDLVVRKGWVWRETKALPYHRLQSVELVEGPIDRRLGLASVSFRAAASSTSIPGLPTAEAEALRDRLVARGVRLRKAT